MVSAIPAVCRPLYDLLLGCSDKPAGLSQKGMKELLKETGFLHTLSCYQPEGRVCCADVLALCRPVMDRLCHAPEADWLHACYDELAHRLFPDPNHRPLTQEQQQAMWFYLTVLSWLLEGEKARCAYDPLSDVNTVTQEELEASLIPEEYAVFVDAVRRSNFITLLRLGREIMPFDPASHTIGVHHMALHMARQAARAGLNVDVPLVSASSLSHDIGKFGCRGADAARVPYLHYYYTFQWLNEMGLPKIAHIAANHSTWDLEFENLTLESLLLIYADFRVRGARENGKEVVRIYTLAESYDMIFSKLYNMTPEKQARYRTVYTKLQDFEQFLCSYGVRTEPLEEEMRPISPKNAALFTPEETLKGICNVTFENNVSLMYAITKDVTFGQLLEQARSEKNLHRIRTYLRLFEEYSTYMTGANKRLTLSLLYELLMHHQGDVRRTSARVMGEILANSGPKYRKELPSSAPETAMAPATAAFLAESVDLWKYYIEICLHPDHKISAKHAQRISNSLKIIAANLLRCCDSHEILHYLEPLTDQLLHSHGDDRFILADALYYVPLEVLPEEQLLELLDCFLKMLPDSDEPLQIVILRRLEMLLPFAGQAGARRIQCCLAALPQEQSCAVSYLCCRICKAMGLPQAKQEPLPVSQLYLSNLKNAVHWMVKLTQVDVLCDDLERQPENTFHTAMHLSNLLSVSEHLPVRERAGAGLLRLVGRLTVDQQNEIVVDLLRQLETGQDEISAYIPRYLGVLMIRLPDKELDECLDCLEGYVRTANVSSATAALLTLGRLLSVISAEDQVHTQRLLGLLLTGVAHYDDTIHQVALTVLCEDVLSNSEISMVLRRQYFLVIGKKLLTLLKEPREGRFTFFTQAAVLNHLYRFLVECRVQLDGFSFQPLKPAAFFPGTFDPFSAGHKRIVEEICRMGCEVYLAIDEFSWSKQPLPKLLRRQIASMSVADQLDVYLFPDEIPVNIASPEDLARLKSLFPNRELFLVVGSDVILNASAYRNPEPGGAGDYDHIIFLREEGGAQALSTIETLVRGKRKLLSLPEFYETVSSTRIREYVDKNMDISMLVDPMVQNFIYENGLYLRAPQFKQVLQAQDWMLDFSTAAPEELKDSATSSGPCYYATLRHRQSGRLQGWVTGHTISAAQLYPALGSLETAEFVRRHTSGRILLIDRLWLAQESCELSRLLVNELLVRCLSDDHTYALYLRKKQDGLGNVLPQLGFLPVQDRQDVLFVDMRTPVIFVQDVLRRFKEPHCSDPVIREAVLATRTKIRLALAQLFPGRLIAAFDAEILNQALMEKVEAYNGVLEVPEGKRQLGPYMCVPYGKTLSGEVVPNTVTKSLHVDKAYQGDIYHFVIKEYPGYSNLANQARTIKSFHQPVILVDDLLHKGYRLEKLDAIFKQEDLEIQKIIVSILSGRGKDLMDLQGREVECEYFIPNLLYWFTESLLYPFIGGDSIDDAPAAEGLLPTANLILPYEYPGFIRDVPEQALMNLSQTALENARDLLQVVERQHQKHFSTGLTIRRLAEAFNHPRIPYRGRHIQYDLSVPASSYVQDDIAAFDRIRK